MSVSYTHLDVYKRQILILAGVTIDAVFSENGIINKAKEAANTMNNAVANDQKELNDLINELDEIMNGWRKRRFKYRDTRA